MENLKTTLFINVRATGSIALVFLTPNPGLSFLLKSEEKPGLES